jgi:hypothetical protein
LAIGLPLPLLPSVIRHLSSGFLLSSAIRHPSSVVRFFPPSVIRHLSSGFLHASPSLEDQTLDQKDSQVGQGTPPLAAALLSYLVVKIMFRLGIFG